MKVVIFYGGQGTQVRDVQKNIPKGQNALRESLKQRGKYAIFI